MDSKEIYNKIKINNPDLDLQSNQQLGAVLVDYFKILFRRKWLILICTMAVVTPVTIWTLNISPIYRAEATIIYEEASDTAFLLDLGQSFYSKSAIRNMIEQIKSRTLAEEVAYSLPDEIMDTFKFPENLPGNMSREKFVAGLVNENLAVSNIRGADILKISVQANHPNAAKIIADTYVNRIIDWNLKKKKKEITGIRDFVEGQLSSFQEKLGAAEENLVEFKEDNDLIILSDASSELIANLTETEIAYTQIQAERQALEQRQWIIEQKKQELVPSLVVSNSENAQQLKDELLRLETQYSRLQTLTTPQDPAKMATLRDNIYQTKQRLIDELMRNSVRDNLIDPLSQVRSLLQESITIEVDIETYRAREWALKKNLDRYNTELQMLPKQELELARLVRAKEVNDKIYAMLLEKREEARITEAGKVGDVRVIDYAQVPIDPIEPKKKKNVALGSILGFSLGVGLAFLLDSIDNSLRSEQDVEKYLNLPVLASIPRISSNGVFHQTGKNGNTEQLYSPKLLSQILKKSHVFEAYRSLQLNFSFLNPDKEFKTILITSSAPGEGKTLSSLNIAQLYAQEGTKTLVIDCDLRRPMIHNALKLRQEPGLTNALIQKDIHLESFIQYFHNENLAVLTCGAIPPNPSELLLSQKMKALLTQAQDKFDLVILDSPPIISVTDSLILGQKVDGVILVLRSGKTNREVAVKAKKMLENGSIKIAGTLLNDVDVKDVYGYYKDYYYYEKKKEHKIKS